MKSVCTPKPGQTAQALVGTALLGVALTLWMSMKVGMESPGKASWPALTPTPLRLRLAGLEGSPKPPIRSSRALLSEEKQKFQAATGGPAFIENKGQWHPDVLYLCRLGGLDAWITKWGVNYTFFKLEEKPSAEAREPFLGEKFGRREVELIGHRVLMKLRGCAAHPQREGREVLAGYYNYLIGNDPTRHATYVRRYKEAWVKGVYAGIDMRYYLEGGRLRYDWVVQPGGDPSQIVFGLEGSEKSYIDSEGRLVFMTRFGEVKLAELRVYQGDREIAGRFVERPGGWGIAVGSYDPTQLLVIDPLVYSTYIGGSGSEWGNAIAVDGSGHAYVTGYTYSTDYDVTPGAFQTTKSTTNSYEADVFVTKLNATGTALVYSTYIGGSGDDRGFGIAVDGSGNAYVTGYTTSTDYDVTLGAFQTTRSSTSFNEDVFVTKLNATGTALVYSTYIGGSGDDGGFGIAVDGSGYAYVTGTTRSTNYPVTLRAFQTTNGGVSDVFVTKLNATGTALVYSTYIGGSGDEEGRGIAVDGSGNAYVTGYTTSTNYDVTPGAFQTRNGGRQDVFVTKLNATGTALVYSTYIGGNSDEVGRGIALDGSGNAYVTGGTLSPDYDVTPGAFQTTNGGGRDVFVTKLNATGTALVYSTYIGGSSSEEGHGIAVDGSGNAYVTGLTYSTDYDVTPGAFQTTKEGGGDVFVTKLNATGTALVYSTYIGGSDPEWGYGIAVDGSGYAYVTGYTTSLNYDVTPGAFQTTNGGARDVFVTKVCCHPIPITLTSAPGTNNQTVCVNTAITPITYSITGATGATFSGLPAGVTGTFSGGNITISGTPTVTGTFYYTVTLTGTGGCGSVTAATGTIIVRPNNTITLTSAPGTDNQTVCVNTAITSITYSTTGATGATFSGLPTGVRGTFFSSGNITISGTPTVAGTFNYTVTLTGGCGNVTATGTIIVQPNNPTITLTSAPGTNNQTVCVNTDITPITYGTTGATGATFSGLPAGVTGTFSGGNITISGTPTVTGTFNYTVTLTGGCGGVTTARGTIIVRPNSTITRTSAPSTDNQTVCVSTAITPIRYSTTGATGATFSGLPTGVTGTFSGGNITISGTPTVTGTFNYTVTLTGGCGNVTATGTIIVQPNNTITLTSAPGTDNQTVCVNTAITPITYSTTGATGATFADLPPGVTGTFLGGNITISGTPTASGTFSYTVTLTGGCGNVTATGTIIVQPNITLTSAPGTDNQTVCVNTAITPITYSTTGATVATFADLPAGVTGTFSGGYITISGTPTASGTFNYTVTLTGGCGNVTATGTIIVQPNNTITLTSAPGTNNQTVCVNTAITPITYNTTGATGATFSDLPPGVTGTFSGGNITISGTPTVAGTFTYTVTLTGGCGNVTATGTIMVQPDNTITRTSAPGTDNQTVCVNTAITPITYSTTGATGATFADLPAGVTGTFSGGDITISGTPTVAGTFNYTVTLTGGCGNVTATGTIIVRPNNTITLTSAPSTDNQTVCVNTAITPITYSITGATGATFSGLPAGVTGTFSGGDITISGTPTVAGTFTYTVTLTGGCGNVTATGTIVVQPDNAITLASAPGTDNQTVCVNTAITPIIYSTTGATGATFSGLPTGVTGTFSGGNIIIISGTPTVTGTFNYTVTLTGGCGNVTARGTIIVRRNTTITLTSAPGTDNQTVCVNTAITPIIYSITGATGATFSGLPTGVTGTFSGGYITISGTPTVAGTFNYTVTLTGGCGNVTATGTLVVNTCQPNSLLGGGGGGPTWRVYPNPTSGSFTIESSEDGTFELINGHGQVVQVYAVRRGRAELRATLSAGVYYLREQRSGTVQKVVILE